MKYYISYNDYFGCIVVEEIGNPALIVKDLEEIKDILFERKQEFNFGLYKIIAMIQLIMAIILYIFQKNDTYKKFTSDQVFCTFFAVLVKNFFSHPDDFTSGALLL